MWDFTKQKEFLKLQTYHNNIAINVSEISEIVQNSVDENYSHIYMTNGNEYKIKLSFNKLLKLMEVA